MNHVRDIYFKRHQFRFEDVWKDRKYRMRNINDLNGFLCCFCCVIPFCTVKACIMLLVHLVCVVPFTLLVSVALFPYQLIMLYVTTLRTEYLGPKIKLILFATNWLLYSLFLCAYLLLAYASCICFSFYASFKVTLSANFVVVGGFCDSLSVVCINLRTFAFNNTRVFHRKCVHIQQHCLDSEQDEEAWDISLIAWCDTIVGVAMTLLAVLLIYVFVGLEVLLYFIPFCVHILCALYVFKFLRHYFSSCICKQPCLALIACPFLLLPVFLVPVGVAIYLLLYVWLFSAFCNKAVVLEAEVDSAFDCCQQWSFICNTIALYNEHLARYAFQTCWKCHCCFRRHLQADEEEDDEFYELDLEAQKQSKGKKTPAGYQGYEYKLSALTAEFWTTKRNQELVTCGKRALPEDTKQDSSRKKKMKTRQMMTARSRKKTQKLNIEMFTEPKPKKKHKRKPNRDHAYGKDNEAVAVANGAHDVQNIEMEEQHSKKKHKHQRKAHKKQKRVLITSSDSHRYKYSHVERTDDEDITEEDDDAADDSYNVLLHDERPSINKQQTFSYPRTI